MTDTRLFVASCVAWMCVVKCKSFVSFKPEIALFVG